MSNAPTPTFRARTRRGIGAAAVSLAAVAGVGVAAQHITRPHAADHEARMSAIPTPCDGFGDCIYTAYWYVFLR